MLGSERISPLLLTSALDGDEWSASHPGRFIPRERAPSTYCTGGCADQLHCGFNAFLKTLRTPAENHNILLQLHTKNIVVIVLYSVTIKVFS
jgi:hypothetical protein